MRAPRPILRATTRLAIGADGRIGSTIYGTILVMAALTAAYAAERHDPAKLVELVASAVFVFWAAYVYANALSESIERRSRLDLPTLAHIADRELGLILSACIPILALLLGVAGVISESASVWLAIALGLMILGIQGYRYTRAAGLGPFGTVAILTANLVLGISVVAAKVTLVH
jgi:hypothetical protein